VNEYDIECCDCGGEIVTTEGWDSLYEFECLNCGRQRSEPPMTWKREATR